MRKLGIYWIILIALYSCEDTVEVSLDTEEPRLVIEATGIQKADLPTGEFHVKLSKTAPYFEDSIPGVSGAKISLENKGEVIEIPESEEQPGMYKSQIPMHYNEAYKLTVMADGEKYEGETRLYSTPSIDLVTQEEGFFDSDDVLLKIYYTDPKETENYYLFAYESKHGKDLIVSDDEHYNGNRVSTLYYEKFEPGDSVRIRINGTGKSYNRYLSTLLDQSDDTNNPFATAPTTVRGNMVNEDHPEKFPLGYFRLSQEFETVYIIR